MMETLQKLLDKMGEKDKAHQEALSARDELFSKQLSRINTCAASYRFLKNSHTQCPSYNH